MYIFYSFIFISVKSLSSYLYTMKQLTCRKCEGHGMIVPLKGHAPYCPFNQCVCHTCSSVMSLRASALVRRFRHRAPQTKTALIKTVKSKNGNLRLRILPRNGRCSPGGTVVNYHNDQSISPSSNDSCSSTESSPSPPNLSPNLPIDIQSINDLFARLMAPSAFTINTKVLMNNTQPYSLYETLPYDVNQMIFLLGSLTTLNSPY